MPDRIVRFLQSFFDDLDSQLPAERSAGGEPLVHSVAIYAQIAANDEVAVVALDLLRDTGRRCETEDSAPADRQGHPLQISWRQSYGRFDNVGDTVLVGSQIGVVLEPVWNPADTWVLSNVRRR